MKIYLDYVFFINFLFDFILLMGVSFLLKRNTKFYRIILGSLFGTLSIVILFINMSSFLFFISKILIAVLMVIISFNYKDIKYTFNNLFYLMILSIIVGGFLYLINIETGYDHIGMTFINNGKNLNILILIMFAILIVVIYLYKMKKFKNNNKFYYKVDIYLNNKILKLNGFVDTGNNLYDPYFKKPVLILNNNIEINSNKIIYVPYNTIDGTGIMKSYLIEKIYIYDIGYKYNVIIGISNDKFNLSGVDIILNKEMIE